MAAWGIAIALLRHLVPGYRHLIGRIDRCEKERDDLRRVLLSNTARIEHLESMTALATIVCDERGVIIEWGTGNTGFLKYTRAQAIGMDVTAFIPAAYRQAHLEGFGRFVDYLKNRQPTDTPPTRRVVDCPIVTGAGEQIPVQMTLSGFRNASGEAFCSADIRRL